MKNRKLSILILCVFVIGLSYFNSSAFGQTKPIELTYSTHMPPQHGLTVMANEWGKEVEKRTNGMVKVTLFHSGTLLAADKCYDGVLKGIADVGLAVPGFTRGRFPLTEVIDLPLGYRSSMAASKVANAYYQKFKPKEWDDSQVMYLDGHGPGVLHSKKAVNRFEDFKGLKVRCTGLSAKIAAALGAAPVAMSVSDAYDALSRGVVDASLAPMETGQTLRWAEVVKYEIEITSAGYTTAFVVVMNKKKWNSLPPDIRKTIEKINEEWVTKEANTWDRADVSGREFAIKLGNKVISLSKEDNEKIARAVRPLLDEYVQNMKKLGQPGEEVLKFCLDELKKVQ